MKNRLTNPDGDGGSDFDELVEVLVWGPDSCWTRSAKQTIEGVLRQQKTDLNKSLKRREGNGPNKRKQAGRAEKA
jgi:hypothetical protein